MICPVIRNKADGKIFYSAFGTKSAVVDEDFIYPDSISDECLFECLCTLTDKIGTISFDYVSENSRIYSVGIKNGIIRNKTDMENASIFLPESYDDYFQKLSKSMRSTIRTARNRLVTDGFTDDISVYYGKSMPWFEYIKCSMMYAASKYERYSTNQKRIIKIAHWSYQMFFNHHAIALNNISSSVCIVYRINNNPVAMMGGYLNRDKTKIYCHRVGYNNRFKRYSPGILMFQKAIKNMISETNIRIFDLTIGGEKYKYRLGAEKYYYYSFDIIPL